VVRAQQRSVDQLLKNLQALAAVVPVPTLASDLKADADLNADADADVDAAASAVPRLKSKPTPRALQVKLKAAARARAAAKPAVKSVQKVALPVLNLRAPKKKLRVPALKLRAPAQKSRTRRTRAVAPGKWLMANYVANHATTSAMGILPGQHLNYWLYLPDKAASAAPAAPAAPEERALPLIVMLHGCGQSATEFAKGTRMNRLAEQQGYAVLYPQQSLTSHLHRCWKWYDKATQDGGGDVDLIVGMIEKVAENYAIDRSRIYLCGVSAGAGMADIIALNHPELIAAVGLHSGPVFGGGHGAVGALKLMQNGDAARTKIAVAEVLARNPSFPALPKILIQGMVDKVVDPVNQRQLLQQTLLLNRLAANLKPRTQTETQTASAGSDGNASRSHVTSDYYGTSAAVTQENPTLLLRVTQIEQLDHAWSGGDASVAFNDREGPDASKMMLDFFALHQRLPPGVG
jgi:poly(hydroxyalkanoate) depolymerase family esterase